MKNTHVAKTLPAAKVLHQMLHYLKLAREAEWRLENVLYRQGKIVGGVFVGRGQEAIGVGAALAMQQGDVTFPCHRDFPVYLIRGFSLPDMFANFLGRGNSPDRGRDNTTHIGSVKLGVVPIVSPLGATLPVACGVGLALQRQGKRRVVLVHFGEGTTSLGNVHESMNFAAVLKLPVIFICNNNQYAYSTPVEKQFAVKSLAERGAAYGMPGESVDGNDVVAVYEAVGRAAARARAGEGPTFLECVTMRMCGHSAHDAAEYVPEKLKQAWAKKDPIQRFEKLLLAEKVVTASEIAAVDQRVRDEVDRAVADAEARPLPPPEDATKAVYCEPDCWWERR